MHEKNDFAEMFKNLARCRSKNNFVESLKYYVGKLSKVAKNSSNQFERLT